MHVDDVDVDDVNDDVDCEGRDDGDDSGDGAFFCLPLTKAKQAQGVCTVVAFTQISACMVDATSFPSTVGATSVSGPGLLDCMLPELATMKGQDTAFEYVLVACIGEVSRNSVVRTFGQLESHWQHQKACMARMI